MGIAYCSIGGPGVRLDLHATWTISCPLEVLKSLGLPRQQQNERSCLTLLALAGLAEDDPWADTKRPLLRIWHRTWQDGRKDAAFAQLTMYRNTSAVSFYNALGKGEAESGSTKSLCRAGVELLEFDKQTGTSWGAIPIPVSSTSRRNQPSPSGSAFTLEGSAAIAAFAAVTSPPIGA